MVFFASFAKSTVSFAIGLAAIGLSVSPADALPWVLDPGSQVFTDPVSPLTGTFTLDDESLANPTVTFSNVMVASLMFSTTDVVFIDVADGVIGIDWLDENSNRLSLAFANPLTTSGGTIALDDVVSSFSFTPSGSDFPLAITGSVTAVPEPLTLLGAGTAIALGGLFKRRLS